MPRRTKFGVEPQWVSVATYLSRSLQCNRTTTQYSLTKAQERPLYYRLDYTCRSAD